MRANFVTKFTSYDSNIERREQTSKQRAEFLNQRDSEHNVHQWLPNGGTIIPIQERHDSAELISKGNTEGKLRSSV